MKSLSAFKLVAIRRRQQKPQIVIKREKLVLALSEQIELAKARANGSTYSKTITRRLKDRETGERKELQALKYPKPWWWTGDDGKLYLALRYGTRVLELAEDKFAVQLSANSDMAEVLQRIQEAVNAGEFDSILMKTGLTGTGLQ